MRLPVKEREININASIRMTPLIDIIFLLLIFFILTIKFQEPESMLDHTLPQRGKESVTEQEKDWEVVKLRIKLITEGTRLKIYLQERVVFTYEDLFASLDLLPRDILIVIEPESSVPYKYVIGAYNTCMKSKKRNIVFAVSPGTDVIQTDDEEG